jgi:hypothetical protein
MSLSFTTNSNNTLTNSPQTTSATQPNNMSSSNNGLLCKKVLHGGYHLYSKASKNGESPQSLAFELCDKMKTALPKGSEKPVVFKKGVHLFGFGLPTVIYDNLSTLSAGQQDFYVIARDEDEKFGWLDVEFYVSPEGVYKDTDISCKEIGPETILSKIMIIYDKVNQTWRF